MPSRKTTRAAKANAARMPSIPRELLDQIEKQGPMTAETIQQASMAFKKALIERAMSGELSHHLGYGPGQDKPKGATNHRSGKSAKTVLTEDGPLHIEVPRDREGSFEPILIPKHERRFKGFDERIVAMYARGMTVREIQGLLMGYSLDTVKAAGRLPFRQQLHRAHTVAPHSRQQIEHLRRIRPEALRHPATDGVAVGQEVVEVVEDGGALQGAIVTRERKGK